MGRYLCTYHGKTGLTKVCAHIRQKIDNKEKVQDVVRATYVDKSEDLKYQLVLIYCSKCIAEYNFPKEDSEISEQTYEAMIEKGFRSACIDCFKEALE